MIRATRERDEMVLDWIRLRVLGMPLREISRLHYPNNSAESINVMTNSVVNDDLALSGEAEDAVLAAYWPSGKRRPKADNRGGVE